MNIKFCYRYTDGANYKQHNEVIFNNPSKLRAQKVEQIVRKYLIDRTWFIANNWNIPDMHFKEYAWDAAIDHDWHEFDCIEQTKESATEKITIEDFLNHIQRS